MELSAIPNDSGRWRADLKNWTEEEEANISWDDEGEEEMEKPSVESPGECSPSQDDKNEDDSCKMSSGAADAFQFGCFVVSVLSALLSQ